MRLRQYATNLLSNWMKIFPSRSNRSSLSARRFMLVVTYRHACTKVKQNIKRKPIVPLACNLSTCTAIYVVCLKGLNVVYMFEMCTNASVAIFVVIMKRATHTGR